MTQFAMVEELAFLIKDNLPCKHLILSMEESFVNYLQDETSPDGVMELQPTNPYNRLLLHRLADIFGFAHESIGEGDDRHLILERCPETSIPSILVSDILGQYDESHSPTISHQLLKRKDASPVVRTNAPSKYSFEEREAAYLAARERIFSVDGGDMKESVKQKPRSVPVVARRMIAHALGQRIQPEVTFQERDNVVTPKSDSSVCERKVAKKCMNGENLKAEHLGAAKRMFANALGLQSGKDNLLSKRTGAAKQIERE